MSMTHPPACEPPNEASGRVENGHSAEEAKDVGEHPQTSGTAAHEASDLQSAEQDTSTGIANEEGTKPSATPQEDPMELLQVSLLAKAMSAFCFHLGRIAHALI